jgi:hypothetical protein
MEQMEATKLDERVEATATEREGLFAGAEDIVSVVALAGLMAAPATRPTPAPVDKKLRRPDRK